MQRLKDLRTRLRLTQKELADKLGTTQQTIARWESEQTAIPTPMLKDIAVLFGCSVDELLGVELRPHQRKAARVAQAKHDVPWGTLTTAFTFGSRDYPIDQPERDRLVGLFQRFDLEGLQGWIEFAALDNRLVFLNPGALREMKFVSDDTEAMPSFASPEAYRALSDHTLDTEMGPLMAAEVQQLIGHLAPGITDAKKAMEAAQVALRSLKVLFADGRLEDFYFSDGSATAITILSNNLDEVGPSAFLAVDEEGVDVHFVNLGSVAAIEVPLEAHLAYVAADTEEDD